MLTIWNAWAIHIKANEIITSFTTMSTEELLPSRSFSIDISSLQHHGAYFRFQWTVFSKRDRKKEEDRAIHKHCSQSPQPSSCLKCCHSLLASLLSLFYLYPSLTSLLTDPASVCPARPILVVGGGISSQGLKSLWPHHCSQGVDKSTKWFLPALDAGSALHGLDISRMKTK